MRKRYGCRQLFMLQIKDLQQRVNELEAENRMLRESVESKNVILKQILATIDETNVAPEFTGEKASMLLKLFTMSVQSRWGVNRRIKIVWSTGRRPRVRVPSTFATTGVLSYASPFTSIFIRRTAIRSLLFILLRFEPQRTTTSICVI